MALLFCPTSKHFFKMLLPSALKPALRRNSMYFLGMRAAQGWVHFTMFVKSGWVPSVVLQLVNTSLNCGLLILAIRSV